MILSGLMLLLRPSSFWRQTKIILGFRCITSSSRIKLQLEGFAGRSNIVRKAFLNVAGGRRVIRHSVRLR